MDNTEKDKQGEDNNERETWDSYGEKNDTHNSIPLSD